MPGVKRDIVPEFCFSAQAQGDDVPPGIVLPGPSGYTFTRWPGDYNCLRVLKGPIIRRIARVRGGTIGYGTGIGWRRAVERLLGLADEPPEAAAAARSAARWEKA